MKECFLLYLCNFLFSFYTLQPPLAEQRNQRYVLLFIRYLFTLLFKLERCPKRIKIQNNFKRKIFFKSFSNSRNYKSQLIYPLKKLTALLYTLYTLFALYTQMYIAFLLSKLVYTLNYKCHFFVNHIFFIFSEVFSLS